MKTNTADKLEKATPSRSWVEFRALSSVPFLSHAFTFVLIGAQWNGLTVVATLTMKEQFSWSSAAISTLFITIAAISAVGNLKIFPHLLKARGELLVVRDVSGLFTVFVAILVLPIVRSYWLSFFLIFVCVMLTNPLMQGANQIRVPPIADAHGGGALHGALMGWSRCFGNVGQMLGPLIFTACFKQAGWLPWAVAAAWGAVVAVWHAFPASALRAAAGTPRAEKV